ncbi:neprilysin-1-like [Haemaphysalis longicornis]
MSSSFGKSKRLPRDRMLRMKCAVKTLAPLLLLLTAGGAAGLTLPTNGKESYDICDSPVCLKRAHQIKEWRNPHIKPCEDFYSYACGGWAKAYTIPESKPSYGVSEVLTYELHQELKEILENTTLVHDVNQNLTDKLGLAYKACLAVPEAGDQYTLMREIMKDYGLVDWPLLPEGEKRPAKHLNWTETLLNVGISPILSLSVGRDIKYLTSNIISLDQIEFANPGRNELIHPEEKHNKPIIDAYKKLIRAAAKFMNPKITESQEKILADDLVAFEGKLANLTAPPEDKRDVFATHHRTSIGALQRNFSGFPLLDLLNKEFKKVNVTLNDTEPVEIEALDYYKGLTAFLRKAEPTTVFNYLGMTKVLSWAAHASQGVRDATLELEKAVKGIKSEIPRWEKCVCLLSDQMKKVTGHLYVTKKFRKEAKIEVEEIVRAVKNAFNETLQKDTWMDKPTRDEAILKLQKMRSKIAYPDWLLNTTSLDGFYKYLPKWNRSTPFVSIWRSIKENNWKTMLDKLRSPYDPDKSWGIGAAVVDARYITAENEMDLPAGILQGVFYQYGLPRSLNIGAIGGVAGHELTHGFDDQGSQFDADGRLREWWSKATREKFKEKSECFVKQYGSIYDKEAGMKLNGKNTLGENIADNGGTLAAFRAYKNILKEGYKDKDIRLKGLEELSGEKLFFIAYAMTWCNSIRPENLRTRIQYDPHSPDNYRVNIPLMNIAEFSTAFNCPAHSRMNPNRSETCALW